MGLQPNQMTRERALELIPVEFHRVLMGAIRAHQGRRPFELSDVYPEWGTVADPRETGKAFRFLVAQGYFPQIVEAPKGDDNHRRYFDR